MDSKDTYVITSAQALARPNDKFLDSLENLAKRLDAELIVLPMIGNAAREDYDFGNFFSRYKRDMVLSIQKEN